MNQMPPQPVLATRTPLQKFWWVGAIIGVLIFIIIILFVILGQYRGKLVKTTTKSTEATEQNPEQVNTIPTQSTTVKWSFDGTEWKPSEMAPICEDPIVFEAPADLNLATAILYPGQIRGGNYKVHGGIRFDGQENQAIVVSIPLDAYAYRGSRYIEAGEVQYLIDFIVPCGFMYRLDHLHTLTPKLQALMDTLPPAEIDNSKTTIFSETVNFQKGEEIATAVGFINSNNVSFDWGVYDLRSKNDISIIDSNWAQEHESIKETAFFGVCWLDLLNDTEMSIAKALPGSGTEGKASDFCLTSIE